MERVLLVDDDPAMLRLLERHLADSFQTDSARSADDAIRLARRYGPYAVVISDLRMPGASGLELLATFAREFPDTSRVMLTGRAELADVARATNEAKIFYFLQKPVSKEALLEVVRSGSDRYQSRVAMAESASQVVNGVTQMLLQLAAAGNPTAFRRAQRLRDQVVALARQLGLANVNDCETAALLSHLGFLAVSPAVLAKAARQEPLSPQELASIQDHAQVAYQWLALVEPLQPMAEIVRFQGKHFDGTGRPELPIKGEEIPIGSRLLKVAHDYDALEALGGRPDVILQEMKARAGTYDPVVLAALAELLAVHRVATTPAPAESSPRSSKIPLDLIA